MGHPLIDKIINDGIDSVNVDMLSDQLRFDLMSEAGKKLLHMGRLRESADAFAIGGNQEQLMEQGRWFLDQRRYGPAALFLRHAAHPDMLMELAQKCLAAGHVEEAAAVYESLGDETMAQFIKSNFTQTQSP
ncbi:hypothetical protein GOV11_02160 [Candidatus Woesearchaeota archaeon]|nr:hypothetical protein [Candidatus Woesearchaeota archaeon]